MKKKRKLRTYAVSLGYAERFFLRDSPYTPLRTTRKHREKEINEFLNHVAGLNVLAFFLSFGNWSRFSAVMSHQLESRNKERKRISDFDPIRYSEVLVPTMLLCINEFVAFLSELQTAAYSGAARTLRYALELATAACEFQTDPRRLTFEDVVKICSKENWIQFMMNNNAWSAFIERSRLYEDNKRIAPSFREIVNRLRSRGILAEGPQMEENIKKAYEFLSDYVHPSTIRIEDQLTGKARQPIEYDPDEFKVIYDLGLNVLDIVTCLYIKSGAHYQNFADAVRFVEQIAGGLELDAKFEDAFLKLPYSAKFSENLKWTFMPRGKRGLKRGLKITVTPVKSALVSSSSAQPTHTHENEVRTHGV
jgi:hypothetical protein